MSIVTEPATGLKFYELSHPFEHDMPTIPGYDDVQITRTVTIAKHGVMSHKLKMQMHTGTHVNAPIHLVQGGAGIAELDLRCFFGSAVVIDLPKSDWQTISAEELASAPVSINEGDIVIINTGWHRKYADSQEYFGQAPGLSADAANYLIDKAVRLVGIDTPFIDQPLATSMGEHRGGPQMRRLPAEYTRQTGRDASADFPDWNPAHRALLSAGIPTIENVGGDIDSISGCRCTVHAMPWRWPSADACMVRLVAIADPGGDYRLETGEEQ